jgi:hypothetical protein
MVHAQVYDFFRQVLPLEEKEAKVYFPNGRNSIRIRKRNGQEFIFSYRSQTEWAYETVDLFLARLKGENKNG